MQRSSIPTSPPQGKLETFTELLDRLQIGVPAPKLAVAPAPPALALLAASSVCVHCGLLQGCSGAGAPPPQRDNAWLFHRTNAFQMVHRLHDPTMYKCGSCGLRIMPQQAIIGSHLDEHFRRNRARRSSAVQHRAWYSTAASFVQARTEPPPAQTAAVAAATAELPAARAYGTGNGEEDGLDCHICGTQLPVCQYDREEEQWFYPDCVDCDSTVAHEACYQMMMCDTC